MVVDRTTYSDVNALQLSSRRSELQCMKTKVQPQITALAVLLAAAVIVAITLLVGAPFATAQSPWQGGQLEGLPSSVSGSKDFSGASISDNSTLYTIDNKLQTVGIYTPSSLGYVEEDTVSIASLGGWSIADSESITWMSNSPERLAMVDEAYNVLYIFDIVNGNAQLVQRVPLASVIPVVPNKAIEALAFSHDESTAGTNVFYLGVEGAGDMYRIEVPTSGSSISSLQTFPLSIPEVAGLAIIQGTNEIYVVSESDKRLYATTTSGTPPTVVMTLSQFEQPEGVAVTPAGDEMYIVGESGTFTREVARWTRTLPQPTPTPTAQPTPPPTPTPQPTPPPTPTPGPTTQPTPTPQPTPQPQPTPVVPTPWASGAHVVGITSGNNDVEEALGWLNVTSRDLDANTGTIIGLRYENVCISGPADLSAAHIEFTADEPDSYPTSATLRGEASGDAAAFTMSNKPSARAETSASSSWTYSTWSQGDITQSSDITAVLAEIVSRPDWQPCNDIALFIRGNGDREAVSYETDPSRAPRLVLNTNGNGSIPPQPVPTDGTNSVVAMIASGSDDVEERRDRMIHGSGDLDLAAGYMSGLRYDVCIPQGAIINSATLTFVADEPDTRQTTVNIWAQASGDAEPFTFDLNNLTNRQVTNTVVNWTVPTWATGDTSVSNDLAGVVSEVTNRPDWDGCGHIVFLMASNGDREAVSFETNSALAPKLDVTWTVIT